MSAPDLYALLHKHPFVEEFRPEHIDKLGGLGRQVRFAADQVIFNEGDDTHDFYLIVSGRVALEMQEPDHVLRVQALGAGDELGWSSVLSGRGKFYQARALEPVETIKFDGYELLEKCRADHSFGYKIMHRLVGVVSERLQAARMQVLDMYSPIARKAGA